MAKSQQELEQPAKVYQLQAVEVKVDQALTKLDQIAQSINGVVTTAQLDAILEKLRNDFKEEQNQLEVVIDAKYAPLKGAFFWFAGIVIVAFVGQIIASWFIRGS